MKKLLIFLIIFVISCSEIDTLKSSFDDSKISVTIQNLNDPASGMFYEAWLRPRTGISESIGLLEKNQNGYSLQNTITHEQNFKSQLVYVTIERDNVPGMRFTQAGDTLFTPSADVVICCVINGNEGVFSVSDGFITAPGDINSTTTQFLMEDATANVRLFTPTMAGDNDLSGIWFTQLTVEDGDSTISPGLIVPAFNNGWTYEAFLEISGQKISMGKFSDPNLQDKSFAYSGALRNAFTSFPGEDFINNAPSGLTFPLDLTNGVVSVSLTPVYTDTLINKPFETVLFEGTIPAGYSAGDNIVLNPVLTSLPSGNVKIELDLYN